MYRSHRTLALVPARGGSKGIKDKNIVLVNGLPLIAYTLRAAGESGCFDARDVVVSTDSPGIAEVARQYGADVPFLRPDELAGDESDPAATISHALRTLAAQGREYDILVFLQPTSPLRTSGDIRGGVDYFIDNDIPSLASVSPVVEHPLHMRTLATDGRLRPIIDGESNVMRQSMSEVYYLNGAIYINRIKGTECDWHGNNNGYAYKMNPINGLEVDNRRDIHIIEYWLSLPESARH